MIDIDGMLLWGGFWIWPVLAVGILSLFGLLPLLLFTHLGRRIPAPVWVGGPLLAVLLGLVGLWMGTRDFALSAPSASDEMMGVLAAAGLSVSYYPAILGALLAAVLLLLGAWVLAMVSTIHRGAPARWTPWQAVVPLALGVLGGLGITLHSGEGITLSSGPLCGFLSLATTLAIALVAVRAPTTEAPEAHQRRAATTRATVATMATLAIGLLVLWELWWQQHIYWDAVADSGTLMKQIVLARAMRYHELDGVDPALIGGLSLLAGLVAVWPERAWLLDRRSVLGAAGVVLLAGACGGTLWLSRASRAQLEDLGRPWEERQVEWLADRGIVLPQTTCVRRMDWGPYVAVGPGYLAVGHREVDDLEAFRAELEVEAAKRRELQARAGTLGEDPGGEVQVQLHQELPWSEVRPALQILHETGFGVLRLVGLGEEGDWRVCSARAAAPDIVPLDRWGEPMVRFDLRVLPEGYLLRLPETPDSQGSQVTERDLPGILGTIKDEYPDDEAVDLHLQDEVTVARLMRAMDISRVDRDDLDDGRARLLFPYVILHLED